ncbi:MAG: hypothetical protein HY557_07245 [Euryarchaeota archaeon]|nr:hypothetical protein [Euryarchaeota archaeon]
MDRVSVPFVNADRPERFGSLAVDDDNRVVLRVSPRLGQALEAAVSSPAVDLRPLQFDHHAGGLAFGAALAKGLRANLLECDLVAGALEIRGYLSGGWVRLTLQPGDFDPDAAWDFVLAVNEAKLEAARA